jgi:hypothetical protein
MAYPPIRRLPLSALLAPRLLDADLPEPFELISFLGWSDFLFRWRPVVEEFRTACAEWVG